MAFARVLQSRADGSLEAAVERRSPVLSLLSETRDEIGVISNVFILTWAKREACVMSVEAVVRFEV